MTAPAQTQPGPASLALLAGLVVLGTGPAALSFLMLLAAGDESGVLGGIAQLVMEGGGASYGVLLAGALASLVAAGLAGLSVRRPDVPAPLALLPFLLPMLAAVGGVAVGMRSVLSAIAGVSPADKGVILLAATGELESLMIQALALAAAGAVAVAVAALVTLGAPGRGGRVVTLLGAGVLGLSLAVAAAQDAALRAAFVALSHCSPADRLTLLAGSIDEWQRLNRLSNALFLAALLVTAVGAAVLAARNQQAAAVGTGAALLVAAVGLRGFESIASRQLFVSSAHPASVRADWLPVAGRAPLSERFVALDDETTAEVDTAVLRRARGVEPESPWVAVELRAGVSKRTVLRALQTAHHVRTNVELIGQGPEVHLDAPPVFGAALAVVSDVLASAPVRVLFEGEACDGCAGKATLTSGALQVVTGSGEQLAWKQGQVPQYGEVDGLPGVEFTWGAGTDELVTAALIALSHGHLLVVRVPPPQPPPVLPDD